MSPSSRCTVLGGLIAGLVVAVSAEARLVEIRVLHTTDVHGHLLPTRDYDGHDNVGGLLRCATLIRKLRAEQPNTLLVDCGDLYQGGAESFLTGGSIMIRALDALKYDAWVLGNHEFDWGWEKLAGLQEVATVPVLAANIVTRPDFNDPLTRVRPFVIRDVDGVKVVIIGLTTPGIPSWSRPDLLGHLEFEHSIEALTRIMPAVRATSPDIIILAAHQGYRPHGDDYANEISAIASKFPEIDVILGGHSHRIVEHEQVGDALYTQAGYYAIWLGCLDLTYDTVARHLAGKEAHVHPVSDQYEMDKELTSLFSEDLAKAEAFLAVPVGESKDQLSANPDPRGRSPVQMLICKALAEATSADMVLHGALTDDAVAPGKILMKDVWRIVPYENRIGVMTLTSAELAEILNENMKNRGGIQFMGAYGLEFDVQRDGGETRVSNLRLPDGTPLHPRKRFRVAANSYVLASGGRRFPELRRIADQPESRLELTPLDTRSVVADYIRKHSPLTLEQIMEPGAAGETRP